MIPMSGFRPGIYRHYKGDFYMALCLVAHHETRRPMVLYFSFGKGVMNVRPLEGWEDDRDGWNDEDVPIKGGGTVRRFTFVSGMQAGDHNEPCVPVAVFDPNTGTWSGHDPSD